ncbi:oxygenase MpaB family protein [Actinokineospora sp. HUAS TT18]|uniref:oxygenase MpaB family protein n=1 Tax=Actinokineospora sp. HUAS TT18 TaxID=3447451 RepID=UPI003F527A76
MADARTFLCGGRALVLQVAHPAVGAAVLEHSTFKTDPWPRLWGTVNSALRLTYGGPRAAEEATRLRTLHRDITGVDAGGHRYHALAPAAYFWVHATLLDSAITAWHHFATPIPQPDQHTLYTEWRDLGRLLGIPTRAMPPDLPAFRAYMTEMTTHLTDNPTVHDVLAAIAGAIPPPIPHFPLWPHISRKLGTHLAALTIGTLPTDLRVRLGLPWTSLDALAFARSADHIRSKVSRLPRWARQYPAATYAYATATKGKVPQ